MSIAEKLTTIAENTPKVYDSGYSKGTAEGQKAEYDRFWDAYQYEGRNFYEYAFAGYGWDDKTFNPKYDIVPTKSSNIFNQSRITNLCEILERNGVTLDLSKASGYYQFYACPNVRRLPRVDLATSKYYNQTFNSCNSLVTIDAVVSSEDCKWNAAFSGSPALENLTIEGTIGQNGFAVSGSPKLTHDSLMSIITALKDYSTDTSGTKWVVTLGTTNLNKLTDAEKAIATQKGWTLA